MTWFLGMMFEESYILGNCWCEFKISINSAGFRFCVSILASIQSLPSNTLLWGPEGIEPRSPSCCWHRRWEESHLGQLSSSQASSSFPFLNFFFWDQCKKPFLYVYSMYGWFIRREIVHSTWRLAAYKITELMYTWVPSLVYTY